MIKVYTGISIESQCKRAYHPLTEVELALELVTINEDAIVYSNSPDFITSISHLASKFKVDIEFFLDGESLGDEIGPIFDSFSESLEYLRKILNN